MYIATSNTPTVKTSPRQAEPVPQTVKQTVVTTLKKSWTQCRLMAGAFKSAMKESAERRSRFFTSRH